MHSTDEIYDYLRNALVELFEVDPARITPQAHLYRDLDIDSIDAIDLLLKFKQLTGKKIKPEDFKHVRTVADIVEALHALMNADAIKLDSHVG